MLQNANKKKLLTYWQAFRFIKIEVMKSHVHWQRNYHIFKIFYFFFKYWLKSMELTTVGWALPCSLLCCTAPARTVPAAGRVSPSVAWRGKRQEPPAWWLPADWTARGSSWNALRPGPHSAEWTPGRSTSWSFNRKGTNSDSECFFVKASWHWSLAAAKCLSHRCSVDCCATIGLTRSHDS